MKMIIALLAALLAVPSYAADPVMIDVNGEKISKSEVFDMLWNLQGPEAVNILINRTLMKQAAKKLGVKASESEISKKLAEMKNQLPEGTTFEEQLKKTGMSLNKLKDDIALSIVQDGVVAKKADLSVTPEEIKRAYEENLERLGEPEAADIKHILFADKKEADAGYKKLKAGGDFAALAKEKSTDRPSAEKGGARGFVPRGVMRPDIEAAVFGLKPGGFTDVIESPEGYSIFKLESRRAGKPPKFEDIKNDIAETIRFRKMQAALPKIFTDLRSAAKIQTFNP